MAEERGSKVCLLAGAKEETKAVNTEDGKMPSEQSEVTTHGNQPADGNDQSQSNPTTAAAYQVALQCLEDLAGQDPAQFDEELQRKLAENDAIGRPKLQSAKKAFQRAANLTRLGQCTWLDSEDDSEDDEEEKAWKLKHQHSADNPSSDD